MKIDKTKLPCGIWYEDEHGNIIPFNEGVEPPKELYFDNQKVTIEEDK